MEKFVAENAFPAIILFLREIENLMQRLNFHKRYFRQQAFFSIIFCCVPKAF